MSSIYVLMKRLLLTKNMDYMSKLFGFKFLLVLILISLKLSKMVISQSINQYPSIVFLTKHYYKTNKPSL
jgi:hypothetical protein